MVQIFFVKLFWHHGANFSQRFWPLETEETFIEWIERKMVSLEMLKSFWFFWNRKYLKSDQIRASRYWFAIFCEIFIKNFNIIFLRLSLEKTKKFLGLFFLIFFTEFSLCRPKSKMRLRSYWKRQFTTSPKKKLRAVNILKLFEFSIAKTKNLKNFRQNVLWTTRPHTSKNEHFVKNRRST